MSSFDISREQQLKYLNRRNSDIDELKACLQNEDYHTATMIGHRLKGSGQTFGFPLITSLGGAIEEAAKEQDMSRVSVSVSELEKVIKDYLSQI